MWLVRDARSATAMRRRFMRRRGGRAGQSGDCARGGCGGRVRRVCGAWCRVVAEELAGRFWPGALTMVLPRAGRFRRRCRRGGRRWATVRGVRGTRVADEALLKVFDGPVAAFSANRSGLTSPTTAAYVLAELEGASVPLILDGGACEVGVESTVIDLSGGRGGVECRRCCGRGR